MTWRVLEGDCREVLATLPAESVQTCITSPPYWGLRDYGHAGQLGLERTLEEYVGRLVEVFREVRRVLRPDGTVWINLGDSYASDTKGHNDNGEGGSTLTSRARPHVRAAYNNGRGRTGHRVDHGLKPKDLVGIPWRVAFALQADGWWLRSDVIWSKPNPMPESVTDRPTKAHEYLFLLAKSASYFYDADAVREESEGTAFRRAQREATSGKTYSPGRGHDGRNDGAKSCIAASGPVRNRRSVWTISTKPFSGAHFAVMPWDLVEPCVLAGTSERGGCPKCGAPWKRLLKRTGSVSKRVGKSAAKNRAGLSTAFSGYEDGSKAPTFTTTGWRPSCTCIPADVPECFDPLVVPQLVLDPFAGSGTVGMVARRHGRSFVGIELNPKYAQMARERILGDAPLLNGTGALR